MSLRRTLMRRPGWTYYQPAHVTTAHEKWDDQLNGNRAYVTRTRRWASVLDWLGFRAWADQIWADTECVHQIAHRMERCPNNPRNGGDGFDSGDGTWRDRRPSQR